MLEVALSAEQLTEAEGGMVLTITRARGSCHR